MCVAAIWVFVGAFLHHNCEHKWRTPYAHICVECANGISAAHWVHNMSRESQVANRVVWWWRLAEGLFCRSRTYKRGVQKCTHHSKKTWEGMQSSSVRVYIYIRVCTRKMCWADDDRARTLVGLVLGAADNSAMLWCRWTLFLCHQGVHTHLPKTGLTWNCAPFRLLLYVAAERNASPLSWRKNKHYARHTHSTMYISDHILNAQLCKQLLIEWTSRKRFHCDIAHWCSRFIVCWSILLYVCVFECGLNNCHGWMGRGISAIIAWRRMQFWIARGHHRYAKKQPRNKNMDFII